MGSPLEMFSYLGLGMMVLGIFMTLFTRGRTYRVVTVVIIITMLMQTGSLLLFSGIIEEQVGFLWLGAGLVMGVLAGMKLKMESSQGKVTYKPAKGFTLGYLSLLLLSQILARFVALAVPAVLMISALALGLYLGMNMMVLSKSGKLRRSLMKAIPLLMLVLLPFQGLEQASGASSMAGIWDVDVVKVTERGSDVYQEQAAAFEDDTGRGLKFNLDNGGYSVYTYDWRDDTWHALEIPAEISGGSVRITVKAPSNGGFQEYYEGTLDASGNTIEGSFEYAMIDGYGNKVPAQSMRGTMRLILEESLPASTTSEGSSEAEAPITNDGDNVSEDSEGGNPFSPQDIDPDSGSAATGASGFMSGIAALLNALIGMVPRGSMPAGVGPVAPRGPVVPAEKPMKEQVNSGTDRLPLKPAPPKTEPPKRPVIGSKRADGTVFTKNHGWQNPDFPGLQSDSLKQAIDSLEGDILRHSQKGDTLRTEIAKDELKRNQRELKKWNEDALVMKKIQSGEKENLLQNQAGRWGNYADTLETAENVAKTVSFAADLALAVASSGASSTLTAAAGKIDKLIMAKEWFGVLAEGHSDVLRGKNIVNVIAEQGAKKVMTLAVGAEFGKGKEFYNIEETSSKGLKALVSAGETAVGTMVTNTADDMGITKKFGNGSNTMVQDGMSTVKKAYTMLGGGDKQ